MEAQRPRIPRRNFVGRLVTGVIGGAWIAAIKEAQPARAASPLAVTPYVGEIKMWPGLAAPSGWMFCEGQLLNINQYETLWFLIGTTYGGDGMTTYALPDLRGRAPVHVGSGFVLGQRGGTEQTTLLSGQMASHTHTVRAGAVPGTSDSPVGRVPARNAAGVFHYGTTFNTKLSSGAVLPVGGAQPHPNMQPYVGIGFIIALDGIFPSPS